METVKGTWSFTALGLLLAAGVASGQPAPLARVDPTLRPRQLALAEDPHSRQIGASRDARGRQTDFFEGIVRLTPRNETQLREFLAEYGGTVMRSSRPTPRAMEHFGLTERDLLRTPVSYTIRVNLERAPMDKIERNARAAHAAHFSSPMTFSSDDALRTFAIILDAAARGYRVAGDAMAYPNQVLPEAMFSTVEGRISATDASAYDAFTEPRYGAGFNLSRSNLIPAWQFLAAHGFARRVKVAIVDAGYWLNLDGTPRESDTDFPSRPEQWDLVADDPIAAGANPSKCSDDTRCDWHGTGTAGVAVGPLNNGLGRTGTGGMIADPFLIKVDDGFGSIHDGVNLALGRGADVVNISAGGECNSWCQWWYADASWDDHFANGGKTVFVASAGNHNWEVTESDYRPCTRPRVICVGALANDNNFKAGYSNYGGRVDVFAPTDLKYMMAPPGVPPAGGGPGTATIQVHTGTSASAPFVAGVAAMMKAINPELDSTQVLQILRDTAQPGFATPGTTSPVAERIIDPLRALRKAAEGIPMVRDRFEPYGIDMGNQASRTENNLNVDLADIDSVSFAPAKASDVSLTLDFAKDLGQITASNLMDENGNCPASVRSGPVDTPPPSPMPNSTPVADEYRFRRSYSFRVSGSTHRTYLKAPDINAYNLHVAVTPATVARDSFELNNGPRSATLFGWSPSGWEATDSEATIHGPLTATSDTDYYLVRGIAGPDFSTAGQGFEIETFPAIQVWGNESPIMMSVYKQGLLGVLGQQVGSTLSSAACDKRLVTRLAAGETYYVVINGDPGRYTISLGTAHSVRRLNYFNLEDVLTKLGPVEIYDEEVFVLPTDPAWTAVTVNGQGLHLSVLDVTSGEIVTESRVVEQGERLRLTHLRPNRPHLLKVSRKREGEGRVPMRLSWQPARVLRTSPNLAAEGFAVARPIALEGDWARVVNRGTVKATFSLPPPNSAALSGLRLVFLDADEKELSSTGLNLPQALERESVIHPRLLKATATVPVSTRQLRIEPLSSDQKAQSVELPGATLTLTEFAR